MPVEGTGKSKAYGLSKNVTPMADEIWLFRQYFLDLVERHMQDVTAPQAAVPCPHRVEGETRT